MRVIVAQKGAREHFLAARALHREGMLAKLVVDWYAPKHPIFQWIGSFSGSGRGRAAWAARAEEIPDALVRAMALRSLWWKWIQRAGHTGSSYHERALQADVAFTKAVARLDLPPHDVFFGYSYMSLEMLEVERTRGIITIVDQIDPGPVEFRLVAEEMARNPELAGPSRPFPTDYYDRLRREWKLADVIVVNSEWSREAILAEGADAKKIEVLPLAYEAAQSATTRQQDNRTTGPRSVVSGQWSSSRRSAALRVLWLGQVNVRKGIHYLMEAAKLLANESVHFDVVGTIGILPGAAASAPSNMTFHGPVSRDRAAEWYRQADVFVLPTLSDGFALTQLEALAHGLPVIVTPNCGHVVEDGKTGYIIPPRNAQALADAILRFVHNPGLAVEMGSRCREAVKAYSVDGYAKRLVEIIQKHSEKRVCSPVVSGQ